MDCVLQTPKLEVLVCEYMGGIRLKYPAKLRRLECGSFWSWELGELKNLEVLVWRSQYSHDPDRQTIKSILHLNSLKELCLEFRSYDEDHYEQFGSWLLELMGQRAASGRNELKLYLHDVMMVDAKQVANYVHEPGEHDGPRGF